MVQHASIDHTGVTGVPSSNPQFTTIELGHASDTTIARASAGNLTVEGNALYRAGGTDVAVADGGTGASTAAAGFNALSPMTTAGDIIYGGASGAGTRLAIGNAGAHLSRVNGVVAWNSGTSFPTAATGDRYWRTDIAQGAYYDGTRWLSIIDYSISVSVYNLTANQAYYFPLNTGYDVYVYDLTATTFPAGTNDGSNYWQVSVAKTNAANTPTTMITLSNTSGDTDANWTGKSSGTGAGVVAVATYPVLEIDVIKTGSAGALYAGAMVTYKRVLT